MVLFPACRQQFSTSRGSVDRIASTCQSSGSNPAERLKLAGSRCLLNSAIKPLSDFLPQLDERGLRMTGPADIFVAEIDTHEEGHEVRF